MNIEEISAWLDANQLLVFSIVLPFVSATVATLSSRYATRRTLLLDRAKVGFQSTLKISEFRQQWINDLRDAMSEFQSYGILPGSDPRMNRDFYRMGTRIELLMNPNDPDYPALVDLMYNFLEAADGDTIDKYRQNQDFVNLCQSILKREWERLKFDLQDDAALLLPSGEKA